MTYYVPDLKTMASLRAYNSIEDARAYAIKKMEDSGVMRFTIFADKERNRPIGIIVPGYIKNGPMGTRYLWSPLTLDPSIGQYVAIKGSVPIYKNGKIARGY